MQDLATTAWTAQSYSCPHSPLREISENGSLRAFTATGAARVLLDVLPCVFVSPVAGAFVICRELILCVCATWFIAQIQRLPILEVSIYSFRLSPVRHRIHPATLVTFLYSLPAPAITSTRGEIYTDETNLLRTWCVLRERFRHRATGCTKLRDIDKVTRHFSAAPRKICRHSCPF